MFMDIPTVLIVMIGNEAPERYGATHIGPQAKSHADMGDKQAIFDPGGAVGEEDVLEGL